jgi:hypothetical protein
VASTFRRRAMSFRAVLALNRMTGTSECLQRR